MVAAQPYEPDIALTQEQYAGHVQKRVGSSLRNLKKNPKGQKLNDDKPIGGHRRLNDDLIDNTQSYYGNAIRCNPNDLKDMAKAIWASLYHPASSNGNLRHDFGPSGPDSWCGRQQMQAGKIEPT